MKLYGRRPDRSAGAQDLEGESARLDGRLLVLLCCVLARNWSGSGIRRSLFQWVMFWVLCFGKGHVGQAVRLGESSRALEKQISVEQSFELCSSRFLHVCSRDTCVTKEFPSSEAHN